MCHQACACATTALGITAPADKLAFMCALHTLRLADAAAGV
jgi:RecA/RadA recombinase